MNITDIAVFVIYLSSLISMTMLVIALLIGARSKAKSFLYLITTLLLWLFPQFLVQFVFFNYQDVVELLIKISIYFASFIPLTLSGFIKDKLNIKRSKILIFLSILGLVLGVASILPVVPISISASVSGIAVTSSMPFYYLLVLVVLLSFALSTLILWWEEKKQKAQGENILAIRSLRTGLLLATSLNLIGAVFLINQEWSQVLTPLSMALMTGITYVSIFKHKLFDIKLIVARSVAYVLTMATIGLLYGFSAFSLLGNIIAKNQQITFSQQVIYTVLAIILVFTFQPIKRFFDRISNKLFYRDAYDFQEVLDNLGSLIVGQIDIEVIMGETLELINNSLRPVKSVFLLTDEVNKYYKRYGDVDFINIDEETVIKALDKQNDTVMILDEESIKTDDFLGVLKKHDIAVSIRLNTTAQTVGYLLLGPKKSGNIYGSQDAKLLNIASSELAVAVENALRFDEIQEFNITLQKKIKDATAQLQHTNEKLRALDEAKDEFISMASHQLRTPLTSIKGYVSMLMDGDVGKPNRDQKKLLEEAFASSQRMVYLIADLLNVSRLKTGKFIIEPTDIFLPQVVQGEVDQVSPSAKQKNITLNYHAPKRFPVTSLDETKIRQVIMNFIDNAIYYTPQGGKIDVQLIAKKNTVEYRVIDNGIGVPKDQQSKLFSKFFRADNAQKARPDGTGLGLYMASKVVTAQGGSVIFSSEVGKGSTFGFSFPLSKIKPKGSSEK